MPAEALPNEDQGARDPEDRVQRHRDERDQNREPEGVEEVGIGDRRPDRPEAVLECPEEDQPDGQHEQEHRGSASAAKRRPYLALMLRPPAPDQVDG